MDDFEDLNKSQTAKEVVKELIPNVKTDPKLKPSKFIKKYWAKYQDNFPSNQNINGKVFEELIAIALIRAGIMPFYMPALQGLNKSFPRSHRPTFLLDFE